MVKGGVISNCSQKVLRQLDKQPWVPAYDLSYVVKGKSSDGANFRAACYLNAIIQGILSEKYREKVFVGKVLYQGSAGRVEAV
jgi:hypothetical protein